MKQYLKVISSLFMASMLWMGNVDAQTKTKIKTKATAPKFVEQNFGTPSSITDITDISDSSKAYNSVKNLLDKKVILTYDDNTFRGNEPIRRGDFIVALNSSLDAIKNVAAENSTDNTKPADNSTVNSVAPAGEFTDLEQNSVYYPAVHSLMEKGITAPFGDSKTLNPGAPMTEQEVYDNLNSVFNYDKSGLNPYATSMSRAKFAMVLNNAVNKKMLEEYAMIDQKNAEAEKLRQEEKAKMAQELADQEQARKDSLNSAYKAEQMEIEKLALEKESKSKKKHKNK